jgi:hypothetical protein
MCYPSLAWFMIFNATFNNISLILWWYDLLVEETGVLAKNTDLSQGTVKLHHITLYGVHIAMNEVRTNNFSYLSSCNI